MLAEGGVREGIQILCNRCVARTLEEDREGYASARPGPARGQLPDLDQPQPKGVSPLGLDAKGGSFERLEVGDHQAGKIGCSAEKAPSPGRRGEHPAGPADSADRQRAESPEQRQEAPPSERWIGMEDLMRHAATTLTMLAYALGAAIIVVPLGAAVLTLGTGTVTDAEVKLDAALA